MIHRTGYMPVWSSQLEEIHLCSLACSGWPQPRCCLGLVSSFPLFFSLTSLLGGRRVQGLLLLPPEPPPLVRVRSPGNIFSEDA